MKKYLSLTLAVCMIFNLFAGTNTVFADSIKASQLLKEQVVQENEINDNELVIDEKVEPISTIDVMDLIDSLPNIDDITFDDQINIEKCSDSYNSLTAEDKLLVLNYENLVQALVIIHELNVPVVTNPPMDENSYAKDDETTALLDEDSSFQSVETISDDTKYALAIEITDKQLNQYHNSESSGSGDTFYYLEGETFIIGADLVTFTNDNSIAFGTETREFKSKKIEISFKYPSKDSVNIFFSDISVPINSIRKPGPPWPPFQFKWDREKSYVSFTTDIAQQETINGINSDQISEKWGLEITGLIPGTYNLSNGTVYEKSKDSSDGLDFGSGIVKENNFGRLPDVTFTIDENWVEATPTKKVIELINSIPQIDTITLDKDKANILMVSEEYNKLTDAEKVNVTNVDILTAALDKIYELETIVVSNIPLKPLEVGQTHVFNVNISGVLFSSSDPDIVSVEVGSYFKTGKITALKPTEKDKPVTITATYNDRSASFEVVIIERTLNEGSLEITNIPTLIHIGTKIKLNCVGSYSGNQEQEVVAPLWTSSDPTLISISENGSLEALKVTKKPVTITANVDSQSVSFDLSVLADDTSETIVFPKFTLNNIIGVPDNFEEDLWLQYDYKEMKIGEKTEIYPRRLSQIVNDSINNDVQRPNFNFEIIAGNSIILSGIDSDDRITVESVKEGVSIVKVTYDAHEYKGNTWDKSAEVNTAYVIFDVNNEPSEAIITHNITQTTYDTIYFDKGDTVPYNFKAASDKGEVTVSLNGQILDTTDGSYTVNLLNGANIIGITAKTDDGKRKTEYKIVDARKIEIIVKNNTGDNDKIKIGDTLNISFKGITMPIYKLATIYNPCYQDIYWEGKASRVEYTLDGKIFEGRCNQWDLATNNTITIITTEEMIGDNTLSSGQINTFWFGDEAGRDKIKEIGDINTGADVHNDMFSTLPNITFTVLDEISDNVPVTSISVSYTDEKTMGFLETDGTLQLNATVLPLDATNKNVVWSSSNTYFATVDENGLVVANAPNSIEVPQVIITAKSADTGLSAQFAITIFGDTVVERPVTDKAQNVIEKIDNLGEINSDSKDIVDSLKKEYDSLTKPEKDSVNNSEKLFIAVNRIKSLSLQEEFKTSLEEVRKNFSAKIKEIQDVYKKLTGKSLDTKNIFGEIEIPVAASDIAKDLMIKVAKSEYLLTKQLDELSTSDEISILLLYEEYNQLDDTQKALFVNKDILEESVSKVAEKNHTDIDNGVKINGLPANIKIHCTPITSFAKGMTSLNTLKEKADQVDVITMWDISLENVLTGDVYKPEKNLTMELDVENLTGYEEYVLVHYKDDKTIEYLATKIIDDKIVATVNSFSSYAIGGVKGEISLDIPVIQSEKSNLSSILIGIGIAIILAILGLKVRYAKQKKVNKEV